MLAGLLDQGGEQNAIAQEPRGGPTMQRWRRPSDHFPGRRRVQRDEPERTTKFGPCVACQGRVPGLRWPFRPSLQPGKCQRYGVRLLSRSGGGRVGRERCPRWLTCRASAARQAPTPYRPGCPLRCALDATWRVKGRVVPCAVVMTGRKLPAQHSLATRCDENRSPLPCSTAGCGPLTCGRSDRTYDPLR